MIPLDDFEAMLSRLLVLRKTVESLDPTNTTAKRHENDDALS